MRELNKKEKAMNRIEVVEERLKFIEAQFGIEFVEASTQEVAAHYRKVQQDEKPTERNGRVDGGASETEEEYFDEGTR